MKKELEKLIEKIKEREEYLMYMEETSRMPDDKDYYMGKWYECNRIRRELEGMIKNEK